MSNASLEIQPVVNRYYDPATEEWLSVDPDVALTGQPYTFTGDDPINISDALGLQGSGGYDPTYIKATAKTKAYCKTHPHATGHNCGGLLHEVVGTLHKAASHTVSFVKSHEVAIGIGLGVLSLGLGGVGLLATASVIELSTGVSVGVASASVGSGILAGSIDGGKCASGDDAACAGAVLGGAGALAGGGPLAADLAGVEETSTASALLRFGAGGLALNFGLAGVTFDVARTIH